MRRRRARTSHVIMHRTNIQKRHAPFVAAPDALWLAKQFTQQLGAFLDLRIARIGHFNDLQKFSWSERRATGAIFHILIDLR